MPGRLIALKAAAGESIMDQCQMCRQRTGHPKFKFFPSPHTLVGLGHALGARRWRSRPAACSAPRAASRWRPRWGARRPRSSRSRPARRPACTCGCCTACGWSPARPAWPSCRTCGRRWTSRSPCCLRRARPPCRACAPRQVIAHFDGGRAGARLRTWQVLLTRACTHGHPRTSCAPLLCHGAFRLVSANAHVCAAGQAGW